MTVEQIYDTTIKPLPEADRLRLAKIILSDVSPGGGEPRPSVAGSAPSGRSPGQILAEIASLTQCNSQSTRDGRDHDNILSPSKSSQPRTHP
jgi:hypothetical protein